MASFTADAVRWGTELKRAGAQGLVVFPPLPVFLGNPLPAEMVVRYHAAIGGIGLPFVAFQLPKGEGPDLSADVMRELVRLPNFVGVKEASCDAVRTIESIDTAARLPRKLGILTGSDQFILEAMLMGCDGALIGFAGTATTELIRMHAAVRVAGHGDGLRHLGPARAAGPVLLAAAGARLPAADEGGPGDAGAHPERGGAGAADGRRRRRARRARGGWRAHAGLIDAA